MAVALVAGVSTGLALAVPAVPMTLGAIGVSIIAQLVRPIPRVRFLLFLMVVAMVGALHASMRMRTLDEHHLLHLAGRSQTLIRIEGTVSTPQEVRTLSEHQLAR
ncbi:MAG: hypothetical protein KC983_02545, partial [Phycisphaerales bacterium]|nr:hypothetical protein [Phycisphaerales bacterium]